MKLEKENELLGALAISLISGNKGECPTDEEFAVYLEGKRKREKKKALMSHFVSCLDCRERLSILTPAFQAEEDANVVERLLAFFRRPLVLAPMTIIFLALVVISLNVYRNSYERSVTGERYRGGDLVSVSQVDLSPDLLKIIKEGDTQEMKSHLVKELPPGSEVSTIEVEDKVKSFEYSEGNRKGVLILYSNGLLKVKLGE